MMKRDLTLTLDFLPADIGEPELRLVQSLTDAHRLAALNNKGNVSNTVVALVAGGSGSFTSALAAAILSTGAIHAPLVAARKILREASYSEVHEAVKAGRLIPGFGHSFFRDKIDPAFAPVASSIASGWPNVGMRITELRDAIWNAGKKIWPNAALITAAVCEIARVPDGLEICLMVLPRMPVWATQAVGKAGA